MNAPMPISNNALATILLLALGRLDAGQSADYSTDLADATLGEIGRKLDRAIESARTDAQRVARDAAEFIERECRPYGSNALSVNTVADLQAASARIEIMNEIFSDLFASIVERYAGIGLSPRNVAHLIQQHLDGRLPHFHHQAWSAGRDFRAEAADLLRLGIGLAQQERDARKAREEEQKAAHEREQAEKAAAKKAARRAARAS